MLGPSQQAAPGPTGDLGGGWILGHARSATLWRAYVVAIDPVRALPSALLAELRERLEESAVPYDVDIVDLSLASPEIRASVQREGLLWNG